jgi:uncharacterized protein with GYD domain
LTNYSPDAAKGIVETGPATREEYVHKALAESGAKVEAFYFVEGGEWDLIVIADIPDAPGTAIATYLQPGSGNLRELAGVPTLHWRRGPSLRLTVDDNEAAVLRRAVDLIVDENCRRNR